MARGEKRPPSYPLAVPSIITPTVLCLFVPTPAVGHRLQLLLPLLEPSPSDVTTGCCSSWLMLSPLWFEITLHDLSKFLKPNPFHFVSLAAEYEMFSTPKIFPLATSAFTFSFFTLLPHDNRFLISWNESTVLKYLVPVLFS